MPFPYFIRKLFQDDGAGDKLNPKIVPTTVNGVAADAVGNITIKDTNIANGPFLPLAGGNVTGVIIAASEAGGRFDIDMAHSSGGMARGYRFMLGAEVLGEVGCQVSGTGSDDLLAFYLGPAWNSNASFRIYASGNRLSYGGKDLTYVTDRHIDGGVWYRKYNDGWIEQGGNLTLSGNVSSHYGATINVSFPTPFSRTPLLTLHTGSNALSSAGYSSRTTTGFTASIINGTGATVAKGIFSWFACGR